MYLPPLLRLENDRIYSYVLLLFIDYNIDNCIVISAWLAVVENPAPYPWIQNIIYSEKARLIAWVSTELITEGYK